MALLNNLVLEKTADLMRVEGQDLGVFILSEGDLDTVKVLSYSASESISGKVELPPYSTSTDGLRLSERSSEIVVPKLSLEQIFENRETLLEALFEDKVPSPIFIAIRRLTHPDLYPKLMKLAKACAPKEEREIIENYEYDLCFDKGKIAELDKKQLRMFRSVQLMMQQIAAENNMMMHDVLYHMSLSSFDKDPLAFSEHAIKFNKLRRKANKIFKQREEEPVSLSAAFLAYMACSAAFRNRQGTTLFGFSNRNLIMFPYAYQNKLLNSKVHFSIRLEGCSLTEFPEFALNRFLLDLSLNSNLIRSVPESIQNCPSLSDLDLSNTMVADLPDSLFSLPKLGILRLENTAISRISEGFMSLPIYPENEMNVLASLYVTGCPIQLDGAQKKVLKRLTKFHTQVVGIDLPKHLRLKNKIKDISLRESLKQHILKI